MSGIPLYQAFYEIEAMTFPEMQLAESFYRRLDEALDRVRQLGPDDRIPVEDFRVIALGGYLGHRLRERQRELQ